MAIKSVLIMLALLAFAGCASPDSESTEVWQEPVAAKRDDGPAVTPNAEVQEMPSEESYDAPAKPWEPDTSMGSEVTESELTFEKDSIANGPPAGGIDNDGAISPDAGYDNAKALTGDSQPGTLHPGLEKAGKKRKIGTSGAKVHVAPAATSEVVETLAPGSEVKAGTSIHGWTQIGPGRYVRSSALSGK
jgi:hypothetical protein